MNIKMGNVVAIQEKTEPAVQNARVISISGEEIRIQLKEGPHTARTAFSCLIRPEAKDLVLCTQNETGDYYILGIIERQGDPTMRFSLPGSASVEAAEGSIRMVSGGSVTVAAGENLNCFSGRAVHKSREAVVDYEDITARGNTLQASFKAVRLISGMIHTMARQVIEKMRNYIRHTEGYDQVNAGQMTRKADGLYTMSSRHTVMVSKKDTKIDGERIHMG